MAHTHSRLLYHIVFSTKRREPWIVDNLKLELFPYMGGILKNHEAKPILINGSLDHVHVLTELRPKQDVAGMVNAVKANSSGWVHDHFRRSAFAWQEGYGAFTLGPTELKSAYDYVANQEEHHRKVTFQEEYLKFLREYEIKYDERFIFD